MGKALLKKHLDASFEFSAFSLPGMRKRSQKLIHSFLSNKCILERVTALSLVLYTL